ncbi:MAG: hypothetical protein AAF329_09440 [Cyanobacteria bacterium P01_A01_bin.17]
MENQNASALACRHCKHFHHEGRRGGVCQRLDVHVRGGWKPCPLMIPSFAISWDQLEERLPLQWQDAVHEAVPELPIQASEKVLAKAL